MSVTRITVRPGGPLLIVGDSVDLVDAKGTPIQVDRQPIALCRCGASATKPFCDGAHKGVDFDPDRPVPSAREGEPPRRRRP